MPRYIEFEGRQHEFPDDITDEEIQSAFSTYETPEPPAAMEPPAIEDPNYFQRLVPRLAEIPEMMGAGAEAIGRLAPGGEPATLWDPLQAMGIFAPGLALPYAAAEAVRPVGEQIAAGVTPEEQERGYLGMGYLEDIPGAPPPIREESPEQRLERIRSGGEVAAFTGEIGAALALPPWAMTRATTYAARTARVARLERAAHAQRLAKGLESIANARAAEEVADAALGSQIEAQRMARRMIPQTISPIAQPGRVGPQAVLPPGPIEQPGRIGYRQALAEWAETTDPEIAQYLARRGIRPIRGGAGPSNEDVINMAFRGAKGGEGEPLVEWLRRAPKSLVEGQWIKAGEEALSPDDIRTFMRLKNRNIIETRGAAGKAEYRLTENTSRHLKGEAEAPLYLKEKTARARELAQETLGKKLENLTPEEQRLMNDAIERPIRGEAPMRAAEAFVEGRPEAFRPVEIASQMPEFAVEVRPRAYLDLESKPVWAKRISRGAEADMFAYRDPEIGINGVAAATAERGLGKPLFMRAVREAGGDTDWILAGRPGEASTGEMREMIQSLGRMGMLEIRPSKRFFFRDIRGRPKRPQMEVRFGKAMQELMPLWDPQGTARHARELDVAVDPLLKPIGGGAIDDPEFIRHLRQLRDKAVDDLANSHNLDADALKSARAKPLAELTKIRDTIKSDVENVMTRAMDVATGGDSPAARQALGDSINRLIQSRWAAYRAKGHGKQANEIISAMAKDKAASDEIVRTLSQYDPNSRGYVRQVSRFLTGLEDDAARAKLGKKPRRSFREMVYFAWLNSRLSGIWTDVKNLVGNTSILGVRPVTRAYLGGIDLVHSTMTGKVRTAYATEAFADLAGVFHAIPEAARRGWHTLRTGESIFESSTKLEMLRRQAQPRGAVGTTIGFFGRKLIAADEFFKVLSYEGDMAAGIHRYSKKSGRPAKDAPGWLQEQLHRSAVAEAERTTYTNRLPPGLQQISKARRYMGLRYIAPFFNTNMNVLLEGLAHTPVFGTAMIGRKAGSPIFHGVKGNLAKQATGGTIGAVAAAIMIQAMGGNVTGEGPTNPDQRRTMMASGWKPRSIKLPGLPPMDYSELTPIANLLNVIGDMRDLMDENENVDVGDAAFRIARSIMRNFTYPPFADGIQDLLDVWREGDLEGHRARAFIQRQATTVIPVLFQQLADIADPTIRRPRTDAPFMGVGEAAEARSPFPGQRQEVVALRDIWGRPVRRPQAALELIPGVGPSQYERTKVDEEVLRLSKKTKPDGSPLLAIGNLADEIMDARLTDAQYDKYQERTGELARLRVGQLVNRRQWPRLSDEAQAGAIRDTFAQARKRAKSEMLRDRELRTAVRTEQRAQRRRLRPRAPGRALEEQRRRGRP